MSFVLIALLIASLVAGGGTVYASQDALPGDPLYGVKMLVEDTLLLINTDEIGAAELHLEFATERLEEAATLVAQGRPGFVEDLMGEYAEEMEAALAPLADGVDEEELLERLGEALNRHQTVLQTVLASLLEHEHVPEEAISAIERAIAASDVAQQVLATVGGAVNDEPPPVEPPPVEPPPVEPPPAEPPPVEPPPAEPPPVDVEPPPVEPPTEIPGPPGEMPVPPSP